MLLMIKEMNISDLKYLKLSGLMHRKKLVIWKKIFIHDERSLSVDDERSNGKENFPSSSIFMPQKLYIRSNDNWK